MQKNGGAAIANKNSGGPPSSNTLPPSWARVNSGSTGPISTIYAPVDSTYAISSAVSKMATLGDFCDPQSSRSHFFYRCNREKWPIFQQPCNSDPFIGNHPIIRDQLDGLWRSMHQWIQRVFFIRRFQDCDPRWSLWSLKVKESILLWRKIYLRYPLGLGYEGQRSLTVAIFKTAGEIAYAKSTGA